MGETAAIMPMIALGIVFFAVAALYATAGFGGGSAYVAILALAGVPHTDLPSVSLLCNFIVVTGGVLYFVRGGHVVPSLAAPFIVGALPASYAAGTLDVSSNVFSAVAALCLAIAGAHMFFTPERLGRKGRDIPARRLWAFGLPAGVMLGAATGLTGIGGGVILAPILGYAKWGAPREIAAATTILIWMTSMGGLVGQFTRHGGWDYLWPYAPLFLAVFLGGQLGSYFAAARAPVQLIRRATAVVLLIAAASLAMNVIWR